MGAYIELEGTIEDKIDWLKDKGWLRGHGVKALDHLDYDLEKKQGLRLICMVDNGPFQAVAVGYSKQEVEHFNKEDGRYKFWFALDVGTIKSAMPKEAWVAYRDVIREG